MNDIITFNGSLISELDCTELIRGTTPTEKKPQYELESSRFNVAIEKKKLLAYMENKGINKFSLEFKMNQYKQLHLSELHSQVKHFNDNEINNRILLWNDNNFSDWITAFREILLNKMKPSEFVSSSIDTTLEELLFSEYNGQKSKLINYILKDDFIFATDDYIDNLHYQIPFLNDEEIVFFAILALDDIDILVNIDISNRVNSYRNKITSGLKKSRQTYEYYRLQEEITKIRSKLESETDDLIIKLLLTYTVSIFETYISTLAIKCININPTYLKRVLENDNYFKKRGNIDLANLFKTLEDIKSQVNSYLMKESLQNYNKIKTYIENVFNVKFDNNDFYTKYSRLLSKRHHIIHNCGINTNGTTYIVTKEDVIVACDFIILAAKKIDCVVIVNIAS